MMYKRTFYACFVGIFMQALITNLTAILFVPLQTLYGLTFVQLGVLVLFNFAAQILADLLLARIIDRVPFRPLIVAACVLTFFGLNLFACTPWVFGESNFFLGAILATVVFAFASGMLEVILSPLVDRLPAEGGGKAAAMSFMHSFYAWGQVVTILLTTLALFVFGRGNWQYVVFFWMLVPVVCFLCFFAAPIPAAAPAAEQHRAKKVLFHPYYIVCLLAICFGAATEVVMNQWISTFAEAGLGLDKLTGDILGMCLFAVFMGVGRLLYGLFGKKIDIRKVTLGGAAGAFVCYLGTALIPVSWLSLACAALCGFFASLLWPGTLVIATDKFRTAGAWMFAVLGLTGDLGAAGAPYLTGLVTGLTAGAGAAASLRCGLLVSAVFPLLAMGCFVYLFRRADKPAGQMLYNLCEM